MAVAVKKVKPGKPDIAASLGMIAGADSEAPSGGTGESKGTLVVFRTTEEYKGRLKSFFSGHGLSLSKGILLACAYFEQQVRDGKVEVNPAGIVSRTSDS